MIDIKNYKKTKFRKYQCLISKLIYLAYKIRLDIAFIVAQLSKYSADPEKVYLQVIKR